MNGSADAATTIAIAQLGTIAALTIFAIVGRGPTARLISAFAACVLFLSSDLVWHLVGWGETVPVALPATMGVTDFAAVASGTQFAVALATAAAAGGGLVLALVYAGRRFAGFRAERRAEKNPGQTPHAAEARNKRLMGILQREHEKLRSVREMHRYLELATRNSQITVLFQDLDLRYQWVINPRPFLIPEDIVGKSDEEILPEQVRALVVGHKTRALQTGTTQTFEIEIPGNDERAWFRMDVVPISNEDNRLTGLVCTAIDISRSKRLDMMRTDLSRRLAETLQRFNLALRSEKIMVFSQDTELRYTWANSDETQIGSIIGRTDDEVIPEPDRGQIMGLKRRVIETKRPLSGEIGIGEAGERRWYDLHIEPNLKPDGTVLGITCASIDITHRKRNEEQMRLVMRELTHRTKNLLTVVIAIARQTSTQSATVEAFVPALIARLRALSAAQDLIVADEWAGVDIGDLVRVLVAQFIPPQSSRVAIGGPPVILSPEASQNLGLAIHELAANAVQYGAFANANGTLDVAWSVETVDETEVLSFTWTETGGPAVSEPTRRGFGMTVIERNLARALRADVDLAFTPDGLIAKMTLPLEGIVPFASPDRALLAQAS
ncbi:PAS domain-containing protein [Acuticoccus sp. I52.16.1]|uniref:PAS domain-containing protein n=1 Tax=Acuticoccus sp. I52.16.1 TaxID=2928472 RepID=UPI001FCF846C|nr:PAS domain-containing protein [Acuticoccus sp. I52.16.1]UOM34495.1 PAS domain-containing protein [Acuticoccus sp. I52.16.1]